MIVGQMCFELARLWPTAWRHRFLLVNIERCRGSPFFECRNGIRITQEPDIVLWVVGRGERSARFRPTHDADHIDDAAGITFRARGRVLVIGWYKASIDEDDAATREPGGGKHPVPRPFHIGAQGGTGSVHKRFFAIEEFSGKSDAAKFCAILAQPNTHPVVDSAPVLLSLQNR